MEPELSFQENCFAHLIPQALECFHREKITFGLGLSNLMPQRTVFKDNKIAHIMTTGLMTTTLKIKHCFELISLCCNE